MSADERSGQSEATSGGTVGTPLGWHRRDTDERRPDLGSRSIHVLCPDVPVMHPYGVAVRQALGWIKEGR